VQTLELFSLTLDSSTNPRGREKDMAEKHPCESCSMPIETGRYCPYCVDERGELQPFEERFERMIAWQARRDSGKSRAQLEAETLAYMAKMPAWKDHPRVRGGK
jgi:hypothetical protein